LLLFRNIEPDGLLKPGVLFHLHLELSSLNFLLLPNLQGKHSFAEILIELTTLPQLARGSNMPSHTCLPGPGFRRWAITRFRNARAKLAKISARVPGKNSKLALSCLVIFFGALIATFLLPPVPIHYSTNNPSFVFGLPLICQKLGCLSCLPHSPVSVFYQASFPKLARFVITHNNYCLLS
jgi:hypothetical protein